ncbi:MAG: CHASE2 domain-containing protein [Microcoleus sp. SIO2G3]|nr:CHASE2 domain-containing protein [Microcoleus sp. SIO2G3]
MSHLVVLNLGRGQLQSGFPLVTAQLQKERDSRSVQVTGSLPAAPEILDLYRRWQLLYELLYQARSLSIRGGQSQFIDDDIIIDDSDITHVCDADFYNVCQELERHIDKWLDSQEFSEISRQLYKQLDPTQEIRVIIQTEEPQLRKLPWYVWRFFKDYPLAEVSLSSLAFASGIPTTHPANRVRILAVIGDSNGIDVEADKRLLENLKDAQTVFLVEPQRRELNEQLWDKQGWDILFFAGHSLTQGDGDTGQIYINHAESLTIPQLKYALTEAIARGLQLAIFNSCDGLGLASQLSDLHIPQTIVMREPVPDQVAQEFLKYFLLEFSEGRSFDLAVRKARERLQGIESEFPGASWLPVIFQNPAEMPLNWQNFLAPPEPPAPLPPTGWRKWQTVLLVGWVVAGLVMGVRWIGLLQAQELRAFDSLMGMRPPEKPDERLLIVTVDEKDIKYQDQQGMKRQWSLADRALVQLLEKLQPHQPAVIGLDIYRDPSTLELDPDAARKASRLRDERFINICHIGGGLRNAPEIPAPPGIPLEQVGFSDLPKDPDLVVRRQIFGMSPGTPDGCHTDRSFSFQIAHHYLTSRGIEFKRPSKNRYQIGARVFQRVVIHTGGYHNLDLGGFEVLVNYRASDKLADKVPLKAILDGSHDAELSDLVRNRIVLIGTIDNSYGDDYHLTPYSALSQSLEEMPGVEVQAHMVSQIVSAVLDKRPLLWWLPQWGDVLWVWSWSCVGGLLVWYLQSRRLYLILAGATALVSLYGLCFVFLWLKGLWLPLIPSGLALVIAEGVGWLHPQLKPSNRRHSRRLSLHLRSHRA